MQYCDRLAYLNLDSLFNRRIKSDLLLCYKFLADHADIDVSRFFTRVTGTVTRGHNAKLYMTIVMLCE